MASNTFDHIIDRLQADASRRRLLAGLLGTATAMLTGAAVTDARKQNSKRRRRTNGGARTEKVQICRRNRRRTGFSLIAVGRPAVPAHRRRGDIICPVPPECFVITGCSANGDSVCVIEPNEGAPCNDFYPAAGVCNAEGECMELPITSG